MTIKQIWANLWKALYNNDEGFSVRKCIAVMLSLNCVVLMALFTNSENYTSVLQYNYMFIGSLLGLSVIGNLVKAKIETKKTIPETPTP